MSESISIPAHVPPELVFDFDTFSSPQLARTPHEAVATLLHGAPDIFYTPRNGGHWIVTRAADALEILGNPSLFSNSPDFIPSARKPGLRLIPTQYDPPEQTAYRRILNPVLSPGAINRVQVSIRERARALLLRVRPAGRCEFVGDVGKRFPVEIFLGLMGAPLDDTPYLVDLADTVVRDTDPAERVGALRRLAEYLETEAHKRLGCRGEDLLSHIVHAKVDDRPITMDEIVGMCTLVFVAGLDTVTATLSFIMEWLAKNPESYQKLSETPSRISNALEELLRLRGNASMERGATGDFEFRGVPFKACDRLVFLPALYGLDERVVDDPFKADFERQISRHLTFGAGPHRCVGSHLARKEMAIFLEEWISIIGPFAINSDQDLETMGGIVWIHKELPLCWQNAQV